MTFWIEQAAVAVCAISGALAAAGKRLDLFGVLVLAVVTAVGGGTIRDLCLGARPVFWIENPSHIVNASVTALVTFFIARVWVLPQRALLIADAFGLALFTIVGTEKSLALQSSGVIAVMLGVITGVAGGSVRRPAPPRASARTRRRTGFWRWPSFWRCAWLPTGGSCACRSSNPAIPQHETRLQAFRSRRRQPRR